MRSQSYWTTYPTEACAVIKKVRTRRATGAAKAWNQYLPEIDVHLWPLSDAIAVDVGHPVGQDAVSGTVVT